VDGRSSSTARNVRIDVGQGKRRAGRPLSLPFCHSPSHRFYSYGATALVVAIKLRPESTVVASAAHAKHAGRTERRRRRLSRATLRRRCARLSKSNHWWQIVVRCIPTGRRLKRADSGVRRRRDGDRDGNDVVGRRRVEFLRATTDAACNLAPLDAVRAALGEMGADD
jgi:hypothetical protein